MKLMFLLFFDNVKSEQERLDYQWLLGFGLDDDLPDHSVRSKARTPLRAIMQLRITPAIGALMH